MYNSELAAKWKYKDHDYTKDVGLVSFISSKLGVEITSSSNGYISFCKGNDQICFIEEDIITINDLYDDGNTVYLLVGYCAYQNYKYELGEF